MEKELSNTAELALAASSFIKELRAQEGRATLVTLSGELGAGKTTFVQGCARALGIQDSVTSPTFVLEKVYALSEGKFSRLVHIDAYRLAGGAELSALGFSELLRDPKTLILLEWPERVGDALPSPAAKIHLDISPSGGRHLSITYA